MKDYFRIFKFAIKEIVKSAPIFTLVFAIAIIINSQIPFITSKITSEIINKLIDFVKIPSASVEPLITMALI